MNTGLGTSYTTEPNSGYPHHHNTNNHDTNNDRNGNSSIANSNNNNTTNHDRNNSPTDFFNLLGGNERRKEAFPSFRPTRESVLNRLSVALVRRSLTMIDLSQRSLRPSDASLVKLALLQNPSISTLKLAYNNLGDEGTATLASAIQTHSSLSSLDIGFNNVGDEGCVALANAMRCDEDGGGGGVMETLCLSGNVVGVIGARALAAAVGSGGAPRLRKLHLTGNGVGGEGVKVLMEAFAKREMTNSRLRELKEDGLRSPSPLGGEGGGVLYPPGGMDDGGGVSLDNLNTNGKLFATLAPDPLTRYISNDSGMARKNSNDINDDNTIGMTELFLCKTNMGDIGLSSVASYLQYSSTLRVLSLAQCDLTDRHATELATSIYKNRHSLALKAIHLSFNEFSPEGIEALVGAVSCLRNLKEFMVDNNMMGGRGAHVVSAALLASSSSSIAATLASVATATTGTAQMHPHNPNPIPTTILLLPALTKLDVGYNKISGSGMRALMKAVAENRTLVSLSLSGNVIDTASAKAVAYVMAHNVALKSLFLDHCGIGDEGKRHVTAGIVSNCRTRLQTLTGFQVGVNAVSLGLPPALEHWTNEKVLRFILLMWENTKLEQEERSADKELDPLHLLPTVVQQASTTSNNNTMNTSSSGAISSTPNIISTTNCIGPVDPGTVVAVAQRAYESLHAQNPVANGLNGSRGVNGGEGVSGIEQVVSDELHRLQISSAVVREKREASFDSPVTEDAIILEANGTVISETDDIEGNQQHQHRLIQDDNHDSSSSIYANATNPTSTTSAQAQIPPIPGDLIVRTTTPLTFLDLPARKKKIVEWLCHNIHHLHELSHAPFDSSELWKLHQHFFSRTIQDTWQPPNHQGSSGGNTCGHHAQDVPGSNSTATMMQDGTSLLSGPIGITTAIDITTRATTQSLASNRDIPASSEPSMGTLPMLKRKVSYHHLHEANSHTSSPPFQPNTSSYHNNTNISSTQPKTLNERPSEISKLIEDRHSLGGNSMQPKSKRARCNRSRISFVPRFKTKLDSFLDSCHHKALILMRKLVYVEKTLLNNEIYPLESLGATPYLVGILAADAEMILLDMV